MDLSNVLPFSPNLGAADLVEAATVVRDEDAALMLQAAGDDAEAFAQLVERHQAALLNFFLRSGAYAESEDLVQETFVRLFRYRRQYRQRARFTTFLYLLARHVWADRWRKLQRQERLAVGLQTESQNMGAPDCREPGQAMDAEAALARLSPKLREVIVLNIYQGLRYQEVADVLCIPLGTVKSRINLALQALREIMHEA